MKSDLTPEVNAGRMICWIADELNDSFFMSKPEDEQHHMLSLSVSQVRMMRAVWRLTMVNPEGVMLRELAETLSLSNSAVSVMVENMVQRGVLERIQSPADRRKVMIRISDTGMGKIREYDDFLNKFVAEFFTAVNPDEANGFTAVLEKFVKHLQNKKTGGRE